MKRFIVFVVAAVIATTAVADAASRSPRHIVQGGWSSRQHVYAAGRYAPWYERNQNENPDFQMVHD
jgi:hypothetical protein